MAKSGSTLLSHYTILLLRRRFREEMTPAQIARCYAQIGDCIEALDFDL